MLGTVKFAKEAGYSDAQAELLGKMDDLMEEAIALDMCTDLEAKIIGVYCGQVFGLHTGILKNQLIDNFAGRRD